MSKEKASKANKENKQQKNTKHKRRLTLWFFVAITVAAIIIIPPLLVFTCKKGNNDPNKIKVDGSKTLSFVSGTEITAQTAYTASGGTGTYTEWLFDSLPAGLHLDSTTHKLYGTPSAPTPQATYTLSVTDSEEHVGTLPVKITITTPSIPAVVLDGQAAINGTTGTTLSETYSASGGSGSGYTYSIYPTTLPAGLTFTNGVISGNPSAVTAATTYTITAHDSDENTGSKSVVITITNPTIVVTGNATIDGITGTQLSETYGATGGDGGPYTYSIYPTTLPAGLNLTDGVISGIPSAATAATTYTITATDGAGQTGTKSVVITITVSTVVVGGTTTINEETNTSISETYSASGGSGSGYTYSIYPTTLPTGLTFDDGVLSGIVEATFDTTTYTITATDSVGATGTKTISLTIVVQTFPAISIDGPSAIYGVVNGPISKQFGVTGGSGLGYTYSVGTPSLPGWLTLSPTGLLSGTPSATAASTTYQIVVTDNKGNTQTFSFSLVVNATPTTPVVVAGENILDFSKGKPITDPAPYTASGGSGTYSTWVLDKTLPAGLQFNPDHTITGTPSVASDAQIYTLMVTDNNGVVGTLDLKITVVDWVDAIPIYSYSPTITNQAYYDDAGANPQAITTPSLNLRTLSQNNHNGRYFEIKDTIDFTIFIPADFTVWLQCGTYGSIVINDTSTTTVAISEILVANDKAQALSGQFAADTHIMNNKVSRIAMMSNTPESAIRFYNIVRSNSTVNIFNNTVSMSSDTNIGRFSDLSFAGVDGVVYIVWNTFTSFSKYFPYCILFSTATSSILIDISNNSFFSLCTYTNTNTSACVLYFSNAVAGVLNIYNNTSSVSSEREKTIYFYNELTATSKVTISNNLVSTQTHNYYMGEAITFYEGVLGTLIISNNTFSSFAGTAIAIRTIVSATAVIKFSGNIFISAQSSNDVSRMSWITFNCTVTAGASISLTNNSISSLNYNSTTGKDSYGLYFYNNPPAGVFSGSGNLFYWAGNTGTSTNGGLTPSTFFTNGTSGAGQKVTIASASETWTDSLGTQFLFSIYYANKDANTSVDVNQKAAIITKISSYDFTNPVSKAIRDALVIALS